MQFSLDFDWSIDWQKIGERVLSIAGTGFFTMMALTLFAFKDGVYRPSSPASPLTLNDVAGVIALVMICGALVQLIIYVCWALANLVANRLHRLPDDK